MDDIDLWLKVYRQRVPENTIGYLIQAFPKELALIILDYATGYKNFCAGCGVSPAHQMHLCICFVRSYIDIYVSPSIEDYNTRNCYFKTRVVFYEWQQDNLKSFMERCEDTLQLLDRQRQNNSTKLYDLKDSKPICDDHHLRRILYFEKQSVLVTSPYIE